MLWNHTNPSMVLRANETQDAAAKLGAEVLRQQRRRCFLSLHFLFKDLTQHQE
jgi:hypothetical protein